MYQLYGYLYVIGAFVRNRIIYMNRQHIERWKRFQHSHLNASANIVAYPSIPTLDNAAGSPYERADCHTLCRTTSHVFFALLSNNATQRQALRDTWLGSLEVVPCVTYKFFVDKLEEIDRRVCMYVERTEFLTD